MNEDRAQCAAPEDSGKEVRIESTGGDRRWAMVPLEILGMGLTGREYDLFTAMSLCAGRPSGLCAAGERHLAEMIGRSRRVVRDVLPKLAERGLIRDTGRKGPHGVTVWSVKPFPPEVSAGASRDARYLEPTSEPAGAFRTSSGRVSDLQRARPQARNVHIRSSEHQRELRSEKEEGMEDHKEQLPERSDELVHLNHRPEPRRRILVNVDDSSKDEEPEPRTASLAGFNP